MKKSLYVILVSIFTLALVACGENASATTTPEKEEVVTDNTTEYVNFDGEGEGQGVIKSDNELSALEEEAEQYSSGEDYDTYVIDSKEEVAEETSNTRFESESYPYVSMNNFWVSDNEIDLIAWYEANGAIPFYCDEYGNESYDESQNTAAYAGALVYSFGCWNLYIGSDNYAAINNSVNADRKYRYVFEYNSKNTNDVVSIKSDVNDFKTYRETLEVMDEAMKKIKEDPSNGDFN